VVNDEPGDGEERRQTNLAFVQRDTLDAESSNPSRDDVPVLRVRIRDVFVLGNAYRRYLSAGQLVIVSRRHSLHHRHCLLHRPSSARPSTTVVSSLAYSIRSSLLSPGPSRLPDMHMSSEINGVLALPFIVLPTHDIPVSGNRIGGLARLCLKPFS
jgi:hypothetical protein